jgi:hypothetical protein
MSANRRPRKKYVPKAIYCPMTAQTRNSIALDLHMAVEACIAYPCHATFDQLVAMLAAITTAVNNQSITPINARTDADALCVVRMMKALHSVQERFDRVGKYGVSEAEATELRQASGAMDHALGRIPYNTFRAAVWQVTQQCQGRTA